MQEKIRVFLVLLMKSSQKAGLIEIVGNHLNHVFSYAFEL